MGNGESRPPAFDPAADFAKRRRRKRNVAIGIGLAVMGLAVAFAIPNVLRSNLNGNESAAIATLKNLSSAQAQMQASGIIDPDGDLQGAYGFFSEMAGTKDVRVRAGGSALRCAPPVLGKIFGSPAAGRVHRGGYVFEILLPTVDGGWANEQDFANGKKLDEDKCETLWICYAWPESYGWSGRRAFMMSHQGDGLATKNMNGLYDGDRGPRGGAAGFVEPVQGAHLAANCEDCEGGTWTVV